jgi:RNA polymerase sigma factor (TIGR02999 family)
MIFTYYCEREGKNASKFQPAKNRESRRTGKSGTLTRKQSSDFARAETKLEPANGEITMLLGRWKAGEPAAFDELVPLVYPQLRKIAASYVHREQNPDVVQATVLVHELYLRLLNQKKADWDGRRHFFVFCARMMRMILIDHARENQIKMRGTNCNSVPLNEDLLWVKIDSPELLDLNRALDELGQIDADKIKLVELRYFLGCTAEETSEMMQISKATVDREMKFIKGWLFKRIHPNLPAK